MLPIAAAPAFTELVKSATPAVVEAAIRAGADVDARDGTGTPPLAFADLASAGGSFSSGRY